MFSIDRRLIRNFDYGTFLTILAIAVIGILTIYSATRTPFENIPQQDFYLRQIVWLAISMCALLLCVLFDYKWIRRFAYPLYGIGLILLFIVLFAGRTTMGAQRWISLGPLTFQPSEFFRLCFIIGFSSYLAGIGTHLSLRESLKSFFIFVCVPLLLIIKQPDLGTAVIFILLFTVLKLSRGLSRKLTTFIVIAGIISVPFLGNIAWENLKDYQKNRLIAFLDPEADPSGIGYNINQSKISVGSGGLTGKGYLHGTQGPLRFLPEKHTDFIFSVFAEEWGFAGCLILISLYGILILRGYETAAKAKDDFGRLLATGITSMFFLYFAINIGMTLGLTPVVGIPLPFLSYGGTALLSNCIAAGILINIRTRRFELFYPV